jgi:LAO/AO transport system kinase
MGDDIQAIKAGILEIADILVINKADRPGLEHTERALRGMLELAHPVQHVFQHHGRSEVVELQAGSPAFSASLWVPPIQKTVASDGTGIPELAESIEKHASYLIGSGEWSRREHSRLETELEALIQDTLVSRFRANLPAEKYEQALAEVLERKLSPWEAVKALMNGRQP